MIPPHSPEASLAVGGGVRPQHLVFGWGAPPFAEQLPSLGAVEAEHFDKDNAAIIRLHMRGFLTDAERNRAIRRVTKEIRAKLAKLSPSSQREG
jgi:hypothetical protein